MLHAHKTWCGLCAVKYTNVLLWSVYNNYAKHQLGAFGAFCHAVMCVSQFLRLSCILYVTALEAYWCTEASAALLLSLNQCFFFQHYRHFVIVARTVYAYKFKVGSNISH